MGLFDNSSLSGDNPDLDPIEAFNFLITSILEADKYSDLGRKAEDFGGLLHEVLVNGRALSTLSALRKEPTIREEIQRGIDQLPDRDILVEKLRQLFDINEDC